MSALEESPVSPVLAAVADAVCTAAEPITTSIAFSRTIVRLPGVGLTVADVRDALVTLVLLSAVKLLPSERWGPGPGPVVALDTVEEMWARERARRRRRETRR